MNRRQFTASLGALTGAAALPLQAVGAISAPVAQAVAPATYKWAELIARAQTKVSPATLARHLRLTPDVAQGVFNKLVQNGVLRAPSAAGMAHAVKPLQTTGRAATDYKAAITRAEKMLEQIKQTEPLVKDDDPALVCSNTIDKDVRHARSRKSIQESPQSG